MKRFYITEEAAEGIILHKVRKLVTERGTIYYYMRRFSHTVVGYNFSGYACTEPLRQMDGRVYIGIERDLSPEERRVIEQAVEQKEDGVQKIVSFSNQPTSINLMGD